MKLIIVWCITVTMLLCGALAKAYYVFVPKSEAPIYQFEVSGITYRCTPVDGPKIWPDMVILKASKK